MLCYAMPSYAALCYADASSSDDMADRTPRSSSAAPAGSGASHSIAQHKGYAMLCYAMPCHAMPCDAMLCSGADCCPRPRAAGLFTRHEPPVRAAPSPSGRSVSRPAARGWGCMNVRLYYDSRLSAAWCQLATYLLRRLHARGQESAGSTLARGTGERALQEAAVLGRLRQHSIA